MYSRYFYNSILLGFGGFSGGYLYLQIDDLNKIFIKKSKIRPVKLTNYSQIINMGFMVGLGLTLSFIITGKPLYDNIIKWYDR